MAQRLDRDLLETVHEQVWGKARVLFLVKSDEQADRISDTYRSVAKEALLANDHDPEKILKPSAMNPAFVQYKGGGWVSFFGNEEMSAEDNIGSVTTVWWPTEGGLYQDMSYKTWQKARRKTLWRPVTSEDVEVKPKTEGPRSSWLRILEDDEDIG